MTDEFQEPQITRGKTFTGRKFEFRDGKWSIFEDDSDEPIVGTELSPLTIRQKFDCDD